MPENYAIFTFLGCMTALQIDFRINYYLYFLQKCTTVNVRACLLLLQLIFFTTSVGAQDVNLFQQYIGRYNFTVFGNTLNLTENGLNTQCAISTSSSASLEISAENTIIGAYLYWAGSGTGDLSVKVNGHEFEAERSWNLTQDTSGLRFFGGFADVTELISEEGPGLYVFSDLDLTSVISNYCVNATNFGGWAIVVVYENPQLPINQLNIYDGLEYIGENHPLTINLESLNVIDNDGAKIAFLAWEGDRSIQVTETLSFNGTVLSNSINPQNNAFNGTNTFTGSNSLYNMDIDVYDIQNLLVPGAESAEIKLSSGQDFVMINTIVTLLNSELPDATVSVESVETDCDSRYVIAHYTVHNINSSDILPAATPIAIYADGVFINYTETITHLDVGQSVSDIISLVIPPEVPSNFTLTFVIDDDGLGNTFVIEIDETNNQFDFDVYMPQDPMFNDIPTLFSCNLGQTRAIFDLSDVPGQIRVDQNDIVEIYQSATDAEMGINPILNLENFEAPETPMQLFVKLSNADQCSVITSFLLQSRNCPPTVYNFISPNNDGVNDTFFVDGLRDIFVNFKTSIYNRYGVLVWTGNNNTEDWNGTPTRGLLLDNEQSPDGTYYYVIELNDPNYPEPMTGFLYLNH